MNITCKMKLVFCACLMAGASHAADVKVDAPQSLGAGLKFQDVSLHRSGAFLSVSTSVAERQGKNLTLYYRVRWLDDAGRDVSADEPWRKAALGGGKAIPISAATDNPAATDYRIQLNVTE